MQCLSFLVEITGPILITVTLLQSMHGALPGEQNPHSVGLNAKSTTHFCVVLFILVEITGIEPVTSCMPCKRSPRVSETLTRLASTKKAPHISV